MQVTVHRFGIRPVARRVRRILEVGVDGLLDKPAHAKALLAAGFADDSETLAPLLSFASAYLTVKA